MTTTQSHFYALIMAGGGGTRLWPLSRRARPKQMLPLVDRQESMFAMTVHRLQPLLPPSHVYVITGQDYVEALRADVPEIPAENFIVEPFGQDSGPAAALGTLVIQERDPDAVIATLPADHFIANTERFRAVLAAAAELAQGERIVTLGISASRPATEFGYIRRGELFERRKGFDCYHVLNFTEKPKADRALEFLASGDYSWNSGMFIWSARHIMDEFARQQPEMSALLTQIRAHIGAADFTGAITPLWKEIPKISLDYAIMEGARSIVVLPVELGWSDIGSWDMLFDVLEGDEHGNVMHGPAQHHRQIDTHRSMIVSERLVVTIGVDDLVIVDSEDALLVCRRDRAQEIRTIVNAMRDEGADTYL